MPILHVAKAPLKLVFRNILSYVIRHQHQPHARVTISSTVAGTAEDARTTSYRPPPPHSLMPRPQEGV